MVKSTKKKLIQENIREHKFTIVRNHYHNIKNNKNFYSDLTSEQKIAVNFMTDKINLAFIKHYMTFNSISGFHNTIPFVEYEEIMISLGYTLPKFQIVSINNLKKYIEEFANAQISQVAILDNIFNMKKITKFNGDMIIYNTKICSEDIKVGEIHTQDTYMIASVYKATSDHVLTDIKGVVKKDESLCVFIITNIKDLPCIFLDVNKDLSNLDIANDDAEYLLPRGISIRITNVEKHHVDSINNNSYKKLTKLLEGDEYNEESYIKHTGQKEYTIYTCEYVSRNMNLQPLAPYVLTNTETFGIYEPPNKTSNDD